jgi:hypothetical protein
MNAKPLPAAIWKRIHYRYSRLIKAVGSKPRLRFISSLFYP